MLNEYLEFEAYVNDPQSEEPRLMPNLLSNKFQTGVKDINYKLNGIDQVMTIIARGFLFSQYGNVKYPVESMIERETLEAVRTVLRGWCGFIAIEAESRPKAAQDWFQIYTEADGWLKKYWIYQFMSKNKGKMLSESDVNKEWEKGANEWEKRLSLGDYRAEAYSYNNIIANAIESGPLKERYCVFKKKDDVKFFCCSKKTKEPSIRKMIKNIAAFYVFQEEHPKSSHEVLLRKLRLFGWYNTDDTSGIPERWCLKDFYWDNKEIMYRIEGTDYAKYGIDENYRSEFEIKLINPDEVEVYEKDYWIVKDNGHSKPLEIINPKEKIC